MTVDRKTINILLSALDLEQRRLAEHLGYEPRYVANVFNGFTQPSDAFKAAFGAALADLMLGPSRTQRSETTTLDARPLAEFLEERARGAVSRHTFYAELGLTPHGWNNRKRVTIELGDSVCCALGVHPSAIYGQDYDLGAAS